MSTEPEKDKLAEVQRELDKLQAEQAEVVSQIENIQLGPFDGSTALPEDRAASEATPEEVERAQIVRDPWAGENALRILRHPPGKRLQWISPAYRERRGLRGWTAVRYDDAIGREIHKYINDPPSRMAGMADIGAVVRRGDVVLAWIDEGIFQARIDKGRDKANRNLQKNAGRNNKTYGQHGRSTDDGLRDDSDPRFKMRRTGLVSPKRLQEYRDNAVGTHEDARITVEGRRLFDES